jgi:hypothetical protein
MSLWRRLERIEKREDVMARGTPCAECGGVDGVPGPHAKWSVVFQGEDEDTGPERCPVCGAKLVYTVTFDEEG